MKAEPLRQVLDNNLKKTPGIGRHHAKISRLIMETNGLTMEITCSG
jgi:hypothetical protein